MSWSGALIRAHCQPDRQTLKLWLTNKLFTVESSYQSSLITDRDQELLSELNDSHSIKNVLRSGALIRAHWLPDRPTNMLWSGALIRAHCHPLPELTQSLRGQQHRFPIGSSYQSSLTSRSTNKHVMIGNSYQSSLTPRSTNKHVMIGSSYQSSLTPRSTRWSGLIDPLTKKNFLRSGALIRAHWLPWSTKNNCFDRELLSELIVTPVNKSIKSLIDRLNFLHFF